MSNVIEVVKAARKRIEDPKAWTRGAMARDKNGTALLAHDLDNAVCYCAEGAIRLEARLRKMPFTWITGDLAIHLGRPLYQFNDDLYTTHKDVLKMFDEAVTFFEELEAS